MVGEGWHGAEEGLEGGVARHAPIFDRLGWNLLLGKG